MLLLLLSLFLSVAFAQNRDPRCPQFNEGDVVHLPHEYDCTKFYKCDWGYAVPFDCRPGEHFSVETQRCEWPEDANCNLPGPPTNPPVSAVCPPPEIDDPFNNPVFLPHDSNCTLFYMCFFGERNLHRCPLDRHWSVSLNRCESPEIAGCEVFTTTTEISTSSEAPFDPRCPSPEEEDVWNPVHLPHEYDCTAFYTCFHGRRFLHFCPPGLEWSIEWNRCEWPNIANCGSPPPFPIQTTTTPSTTTLRTTTTSTPTTTTTATTTTVLRTTTTTRLRDPRCPLVEDPNNPVFLPHEEECDLFYQCDNGQIVLMRCAPGTHWSVTHNRCEWPNIAECAVGSTTTTVQATTTPERTRTSTTPSTTTTTFERTRTSTTPSTTTTTLERTRTSTTTPQPTRPPTTTTRETPATAPPAPSTRMMLS